MPGLSTSFSTPAPPPSAISARSNPNSPPPPPPKPEPSALEVALSSASLNIREATPVFVELAEELDPAQAPPGDVRLQLARVDRVEQRLAQARADYAKVVAQAPEPDRLERRIQVLGELIETLGWGLDRVKVPRMMAQASLRIGEAMPFYNQALEGGDAAAAEQAKSRLTEARTLYMQAKAGAPEPERVAARISTLDELIETLEGIKR